MYERVLSVVIKCVRISVFMFIMFCLVNRLTVYYSHMEREDYNYQAFKEMKEDPDILIFGSSLANCSISSIVMYDCYGITSYNLSARGQKPLTTNYIVEEAVKIHKPKVIVVVLDYVNDFSGSLTLNENILTTRKMGSNDMNKLLFLYSNFKNQGMEYIKYFFPVFQFHTDLLKGEMDSVEDKIGNYPRYLFQKGFIKQDGIVNVSLIEKSKEQKELSEEYIRGIRSLVEKCKSKEIEIVFVSLPNSDNAVYLDSFQKNFSDCDVIDFYNLFDSIGINIETDYYDDFHINNGGAQKISHYLSQYLLLRYDLKDHRIQDENNLWDITKIYCDEIGYDNYKTDSWRYYLEKYKY